MKYLKIINTELQKKYDNDVDYFENVQKSFNKNISPSDAKFEATAMVSRILA